jgi:hypothetical protein
MGTTTFIIDCPWCKAKVAADEKGRAERSGFDDEVGEPYGQRLHIGTCPSCESLLAGASRQIAFEKYDADDDNWSDIVRIYPKPLRTFMSYRIPNVVKDSLLEADRSLQANANIAGCVMLGRALEAVCRDILEPGTYKSRVGASKKKVASKKKLMLAEGIKKLRENNVIDDRLYKWSQQLQAFRNLAAHPEDISISREDADDLQTFVYAIIEYIYDLTDRYNEFKERLEIRAKRRKT